MSRKPQPASRAGRLWLRWRFHLSALLILIPLGYLPQYFHTLGLMSGDKGLGERELAEKQVGPWTVRLAEWQVREPIRDGDAGYIKTFTLAPCAGCGAGIKAAYLRVGKPRNLRTAGGLFSGTPYRQMASIPIPERSRADAAIWLTIEGWDGALHQASWPLAEASPATMAWLKKQGAGQ